MAILVLLAVTNNVIIGAGVFIFISAILFMFMSFVNPMISYLVCIALPFVMFPLEKFFLIDIPIGSVIQLITGMTLIFVVVKKKSLRENFIDRFDNSVFNALLIVFLYNVIEAFNPNISDLTGWLYVMRINISILMLALLTSILTSKAFIRQFILFWMICATVCAVYACYQQWFGMAEFEVRWIRSEELRYRRIFVNGSYRKFSLLSDPAAFGLFMSASSIIALMMSFNNMYSVRRRILMFVISIIMLIAMSYSGTRTAYAMFVAGLIFYFILTLTSRQTMILCVLGISIIGFVLFGPIYGNPTINRIRSTFNVNDPSLEVRNSNRSYIQSYIHSQHLGGGLMTSGELGLRYYPDHPLAGFPPDSGYLVRAMEIGWIGLLIFMLFLFISIKNGISNYYRFTDDELKCYSLFLTVFIFSVCIALYAQIVTTQIPMSYLFYPSAIILGQLTKLRKSGLDRYS